MNALEILLAEITRFDRQATPGPWTVYTSNSFRRIGLRDTYRELISPTTSASDGHPDLTGQNVERDLDLLVALRNAYPLIVAGIEVSLQQTEALRVVVSLLAAKAGVDSEELVELLDEALAGIRAGVPALSRPLDS